MKYKQIVSVFGFLLLIVQVACGPTNALNTVAPQQVENNPGVPQPQFDSATPTPILVNNVDPDKLIPTACAPAAPSISQISTFCANQSVGFGGATIEIKALDFTLSDSEVTCTESTENYLQYACYGPQNEHFQIYSCGRCGGGDEKPGDAVFGNYTCAKGFGKKPDGSCQQNSPDGNYYACPAGSHYDNTAQYCLDDVTQQKISGLCPDGTVTYLPDYHYCLPKSFPEKYNCQTYEFSLGSCPAPKKNGGACKPPITGCGRDPLSGAARAWDQASCSCK